MIDKAVSKAIARFGRTEWLLWRHANAGHAVASIEPLSVEQVQAIQRTMCDKHPAQLKMDFSCGAVSLACNSLNASTDLHQ